MLGTPKNLFNQAVDFVLKIREPIPDKEDLSLDIKRLEEHLNSVREGIDPRNPRHPFDPETKPGLVHIAYIEEQHDNAQRYYNRHFPENDHTNQLSHD